ncbi:hypothetical protein K788_0001671 (plasmid) [Paraburkholderia caribensis MBA4]|uniref:Uncharacterized protein n=1 Tax=Paraburkholderia caribensis MBA4 TaxID=1323664 RepID=A0A0P0RMB9_9BURK|nr:hypothetical protein K788_0001671 [Paraburkholderia caribensis MBA4]
MGQRADHGEHGHDDGYSGRFHVPDFPTSTGAHLSPPGKHRIDFVSRCFRSRSRSIRQSPYSGSAFPCASLRLG